MAQQLRAVLALPKGWDLVPRTQIRQLTITCNSRFRGCNALSWYPWHCIYTHTQLKMKIYKIKQLEASLKDDDQWGALNPQLQAKS